MSSETNVTTDQYNFLSTLAAGCPEGLHFLVAKRVTWPHEVTGEECEAFPAEAWREQLLAGPWYFATGAGSHRKKRQDQYIKAVRAIVIDDVGTKVDPAKLKATPTWKLETSAGNFQWGYMLEEWTTDIEGADALFAGLVAAGLQDKGVRTACRLFRVPGSLNNKKGRDSFVAVLREFDCEQTYTLESLALKLDVKPGVAKPRRVLDSDARPAQGKPDPVYDWLVERGMVRHETTDGWFEIACPWGEEHTDGRDEAKFRPLWASPDGSTAVMCFHGHGEDGGAFRKRFFDWVEAEGGPRPPGRADGASRVHEKLARKIARQRTMIAHDPSPLGVSGIKLALGHIDIESFAEKDLTKTGYAKNQPCTYENVENGLTSIGVRPRVNLMTAQSSFVLPDHVNRERILGTTSSVDGKIQNAVLDLFVAPGLRNRDATAAMIAEVANHTYWHPAKDWIEAKPWDGQDRLEALAATVPVEDPDLWRRYLRRWLLQCIEAACGWVKRPEEQKGLVLVLVGAQRIGKTRWLMGLAPGFTKQGKHLDLNGAKAVDHIHQFLQGWIVELGELDGTLNKSDKALLKNFITNTTDTYRVAYGRKELNRPRCASICASVNEAAILNDLTGSGRFMPVEVTGKLTVDHGIDMQQLWAQVHHYWAMDEQWWLTPEEERLQLTDSDKFQTIDAAAEKIEQALAQREDREIYTQRHWITATHVIDLLNLQDYRTRANHVGSVITKLTGVKPKDRRCSNPKGPSRAWLWNLKPDEVRALGIGPRLHAVQKPAL